MGKESSANEPDLHLLFQRANRYFPKCMTPETETEICYLVFWKDAPKEKVNSLKRLTLGIGTYWEGRELMGDRHICVLYCHMDIFNRYNKKILSDYNATFQRERGIYLRAELTLWKVTCFCNPLFLSHSVHHPAPYLFSVCLSVLFLLWLRNHF